MPYFKLATRVALCLFMLIILIDSRPAKAQGPVNTGPFVTAPIKGIRFTGDLRKLPRTREQPIPLPRELISPSRGPTRPTALVQDPARQGTSALASMPAPIRNFAGLDRTVYGARLQPDVAGDIGPNHFIQAINLGVGIYDKNGNIVTSFGIRDWWASVGGTTACYTRKHTGGPIVTYDTLADRWIVADIAVENWLGGPFYTCIAVSMSGDPVFGGWWFYALPGDTDPKYFPDEPRLAVWPDGIYMSSLFRDTLANFTWIKVRATAMNRTAMYSGTLTPIAFDITPHPDGFYSLWVLPANMRGTPPPAGTPNFYAAVWDPTTYWLWKFHVDWTTPLNSTLTGPTGTFPPPTITTAPFARWPGGIWVPEQGGQGIDPHGDNRMLFQLQYRNIGGVQSLWSNHTVSINGVAGIRWYQLVDPNGTPSIAQQSTFQPDANFRWMGSSAVDGNGNMAIGYSISSTTTHPSLLYAGRLTTDPVSTLGQGETTLVTGTGSQTSAADPGDHGWGNYYSMSVDPVDDCTFWFTGEYYATTTSADTWLTRIGAFKYPSCNPTPYPTNHTITFDGIVNPNIEWNPNGDKLGTMGGIDYYATWDATNLSVAMVGGTVGTNTYVAVVDTDPNTRSSSNTGTTGALGCAAFNGNGKGNYALVRGSGPTLKYQVSGGAWAGTWSPSGSDAKDNGTNNVEFRLNWADLGLPPTGSSVGLYLYVCNGPNLVSAWPPENVQGGTGQVLQVETVFSKNDPGEFPRTYGRHVGDETQTLSAGGSYSLLNGYVKLGKVSVATNCSFTAGVNGNADTSDPNIIRRTYTLTPGAGCTGLTADLTLKYEDGTLANNAPDELRGMTEANLSLLELTGGAWSAVTTTIDPLNNTATSTGVGQFSTWSIGKATPTAVRLSKFEAVPVREGESAAPVTWGLVLLEVGLGARTLARRRQARPRPDPTSKAKQL